MSYKPPDNIRVRFLPDGTVLAPLQVVFVWPSLAWLVGTR